MSPPGHSTTVVPRPSTWSPVNTARSAASSKQQWSAAWPGSAAAAAPARPRPAGRRRPGRSARAGPARGEGGQRRPGPLGERPGPLGVVDVGVGQQHQLDPAPGTGPDHRLGVPVVGLPRSITTAVAASGSATTKVLVPSRVSADGFGASTRVTRGLQASVTGSPPGGRPARRDRAGARGAGSVPARA